MDSRKKLHLVLDNIRSAFNVGSIFRTADATGCSQLYLCGMTATPENPKLQKTALKSTESVKWKYYKNSIEAALDIKKLKIPIYSVELAEKSENFQEIKYPNELALVFGHEINGVDKDILELSEKIIYIPMRGIKESLNVATAAGIIMFEAIRK